MAHEDTVILSTKKSISQTVSVSYSYPDIVGWGSWSGLNRPYDDALAIAILADTNLPSLLIADFKI